MIYWQPLAATTMMELLTNLSRNTGNSIESLLHLPMHYIFGIRNAYNAAVKADNERQQKADKEQQQSFNIPSLSDLSSQARSLMSSNWSMPSFN